MATYLDYCASAPIDPRVLHAMIEAYEQLPGNADSRTHVFGQKAKETVSASRRILSEILGVDPTEVIFTSGATESDNMAIIGLMDYGIETNKKHIITTAIEHKAVLESSRYLASKGFLVDYIKPNNDGRVDASEVLSRVKEDTLLVSIMHVNNETGVIQPVEEIGDALAARGVLFHVDAAQSFGKLNVALRNLKYDMLSISAHKIHGPQGIGALILRRKQYRRPPIAPILHGGQQEFGFRPGTTPVALVVGFSRAASLMDSEYPSNVAMLARQKANILEALSPYDVMVNGSLEFSLPCILNISVPGVDAEAFFAALKNTYAVSNGSACNSGSYKPSYVLQSMGLDEMRISQALRISWWKEEVDLAPLIQYIESVR